MREGYWTNDRLYTELKKRGYTISFGLLTKITGGFENASLQLRQDIRSIVGYPTDNLDALLPFVEKRVSASSIDTSEGTYNMPPSRTDRGSNRSASHTVASNSQQDNFQVIFS